MSIFGLASAPSRQCGIGGVKSIRPDHGGGHNLKDISFACIPLTTAWPVSFTDYRVGSLLIHKGQDSHSFGQGGLSSIRLVSSVREYAACP
jgi:hypothetical protein